MNLPLELSPAQTAALPVFVQYVRRQDICDALGISPSAYFDWMQNPLFSKTVKDLRDEVVTDAINLLKKSAIRAVETMVDLMEKSDSEAIKLKAANDIFSHLTKWKELVDIEERLCVVEKNQNKT